MRGRGRGKILLNFPALMDYRLDCLSAGGHADAVVELDTELDAAGCGPVSARKFGKMVNIMMAAQPRQAVAALISRPRREKGSAAAIREGIKV